MSKAAIRKNQADLINQMKKEQKQFYAQRRQMASAIGSVNVGHVTTNAVGVGTGDTSVPFTGLPRGGGTMEGPIGFNPNSITISGGKLTMANLLTTPTSWCIATGEGSAADDLFYIITQDVGSDVGAWFSGQILILQAGVYNITLKHRGTSASNIYIPSGSDLTLTGYTSGTSTGGEIAILMYDDQVVGGEWILVATSKPLSTSGSGFPNPADANLDMNDFNIQDINGLEINSGAANTANSFTMFGTASAGAINLIDDSDYFAIQVDGDSKLRIYDDKIEIYEPLQTTSASSPDIGSSSYPFGTVYAAGFNTVGTLSVGSTSVLIGSITTDGPIKALTDFIGVQCTDEVITTGSQGTIQIPEIYNNAEPSAGELNGWFGNADGCIGLMRTATQTRLYARSNAVWKYEVLS